MSDVEIGQRDLEMRQINYLTNERTDSRRKLQFTEVKFYYHLMH